MKYVAVICILALMAFVTSDWYDGWWMGPAIVLIAGLFCLVVILNQIGHRDDLQ